MKLHLHSRSAVKGILAASVILLWAQAGNAAPQAIDQDHVVSSQALQQQVDASSAARQKNIETLTQFLSSPQADRAMRDAHIDAAKVRTAIPTLSDQELRDLSTRASNAQQEFAAGHIGPSLLTIIIVAIVVIIVVAIVA